MNTLTITNDRFETLARNCAKLQDAIDIARILSNHKSNGNGIYINYDDIHILTYGGGREVWHISPDRLEEEQRKRQTWVDVTNKYLSKGYEGLAEGE